MNTNEPTFLDTFFDNAEIQYYRSIFEENDLKTKILIVDLTQDDLKEMGVKSMGHRKIFM